ncbi:N-acetyltransferase [Vibrio kasasachensis]|uniref:GNAT family N-acetyltransferase n=1 Tax=Vibrio kasasachensis TaxID=2910248 RepID=UPI003D0E158E
MKYSIVDYSQKDEIKALFLNTFTASESVEEGEMVGSLAYELVNTTPNEDLLIVAASQNEIMVGCVIFSKFKFAESAVSAYILSPAAVATASQGEGVGQKLIQFGIEALKENGVEMVLTYGDPNFYAKVGFEQITEEQVKAPLVLSHPFGWLGQKLDGLKFAAIAGGTSCVAALDHQKYW